MEYDRVPQLCHAYLRRRAAGFGATMVMHMHMHMHMHMCMCMCML